MKEIISEKITSKEIDGKIELTETKDKAAYIAECEGKLAHQYEIVEFAEAEIAKLEAELTKFKK